MKYVSIDIETGGLDPLTNDVLEFGAVLEDTSVIVPRDRLPVFRALLLPRVELGYYRMQPFAAGLNAKLLQEIKHRMSLKDQPDGVLMPPQELGMRLWNWLMVNGYLPKDDGRISIVAAGKNFGSFDRQFLDRVPQFDQYISIAHRSLDPTMYYLRPQDEKPPNLEACLDRAGIKMQGTLHTAVDDALMVIDLLREGFSRMEARNGNSSS